ncbi:hypothetical protein PJL18_03209 [Paenarthrobacter nicotinovorans]|nr:hypothetical protein [Paenarthrobacter nicotinovorans]
MLQEDYLGDDVVELPGEIAQGFVGADSRVLSDGDFLTIEREEDMAVAFCPSPLCCFCQRRGRYCGGCLLYTSYAADERD